MEKTMLFATEEQQQAQADVSQENETITDKYLIFRCNNLLFGVKTEYVIEIITNHSITRLPMVPDYIDGIINLRGQIIPILNIQQLLGKSSQDDDCIIVLNVEGVQLGILVDSVAQIIDLPQESILPVPTDNTQKLVCGMCTLPDNSGTMLVLDCLLLLQGS